MCGKNVDESVDFEIDCHRERSAFPRNGPTRGGDCGFWKTVDGVIGSKIYKCLEVVGGNVQNEVDGHRERGVFEKSGPNVGGNVHSEQM